MAVYKDIVIGCWIVMGIYWFVAAGSAKRTVEHQSWRGRLILLLVIFGAIELMIAVPILRVAPFVVPRTPLAGGIGAAISLAGLAFTLWARWTLGGNWSGWVTFKEDHELMQRGPYALVRHPIYTGILTMFLGTAVVFGRASAFASLVVIFAALWVKLKQEEAMMVKHFAGRYVEYKKRVKAIIPFVL